MREVYLDYFVNSVYFCLFLLNFTNTNRQQFITKSTIVMVSYFDSLLCKVANFPIRVVLTTKLVFLLFTFLLTTLHIAAQNKQPAQHELAQEITKHQKKLSESIHLLENNNRNQKESISKLDALNTLVGLRESHIKELQEEIANYDAQIQGLDVSMARQKKEIELLEKEYSEIIRAYNAKGQGWAVNVLLSYIGSRDLKQFLAREAYYRDYLRNRHATIAKIRQNRTLFQRQQENVLKIKADKHKLLEDKKAQNAESELDKQKYAMMLQKLKADEGYLTKNIMESKKALEAMNKVAITAINTQVEKEQNQATPSKETTTKLNEPKEIVADIKTEKNPKISNTPKTIENKKEEVTIKTKKENTKKIDNNSVAFISFEKSKGLLSLPVESGLITRGFGVYQHPIHPRVQLENHGIDIQTNPNAMVKAVFGGEVIAVNKVQGVGLLVMVQHQKDYYTVYAKMQAVYVKTGDKVTTDDKIGMVANNSDGSPELQFQVWKGLVRLNPADWLQK